MQPFTLNNFNNISKALSFSMYKFIFVGNENYTQDQLEHLNKNFSAEKLQQLLEILAEKIEAKVLFSSKQIYLPLGASAITLLEESSTTSSKYVKLPNAIAKTPSTVLLHLDKSHFAAHTYPEYKTDNNIVSIRVDFDLSTCGEISPLSALPHLFNTLMPDVGIVDYRLRGYTKDLNGNKYFNDFPLSSLVEFFSKENSFANNVPSSFGITENSMPKNGFYSATLLRNTFGLHNLAECLANNTTVLNSKKVRQGFNLIKKEAKAISMRGL